MSRTHRLEPDDQTLREWDAAFQVPDIIRTAANLVPEDVKEVRIVDIAGLDRQADGGTRAASTGQAGRSCVVRAENKGKGLRRLRIAVAGR